MLDGGHIRHRTEVGKAAFQRAWGGELGPRLLAFGESLKAERLVQLSLVETSANLGLTEARGGDMEAFFDGIIELWWPTRPAMETALSQGLIRAAGVSNYCRTCLEARHDARVA